MSILGGRPAPPSDVRLPRRAADDPPPPHDSGGLGGRPRGVDAGGGGGGGGGGGADAEEEEEEDEDGGCGGLRAAARVAGLLCTLSLCVGSHYAGNALNSLKAAIKADLGITNAQYGTLSSAVATVNTVLPICGGVFLDAFGTDAGSVISTGLILFGTGITAVSAFARVSSAYQLLVFGRVVYAFGAGTVVVTQHSILSSWFRGKGLAVAFGLQIAVGRLSSFLAAGTVVPIQNWAGHWGWALWVAFSLCCFSFVTNLVYVVVSRGAAAEAVGGRSRRKAFLKPSGITLLTDVFWLVIVIEGLLYGAWTPFLHMNAEMVKLRFGSTDSLAGWQSSWAHIAPIFVSPFMGRVIDRHGQRTTAMIASAGLLLFSVVLLGFSTATPALGMLIFSLSITVGPVAINSSPALLCPQEMTGTCIGLLKAAGNAVASAADPLLGLVQDRTPGKTYGYVNVAYICMAATALSLSVLLLYADRRCNGGVLDLPENLRRARCRSPERTAAANAAVPRVSKAPSGSTPLLSDDIDDDQTPLPRAPACRNSAVRPAEQERPWTRRAQRNYVYCGILLFVITLDWVLFAYGAV